MNIICYIFPSYININNSTQPSYTIKNEICQSTTKVGECLDIGRKQCDFELIEKKSIYVRIIYENDLYQQIKIDQLKEDIQHDLTYIKEYMYIKGQKNYELLNSHLSGLYNILDSSFNIVTGHVDTRQILIITMEEFIIGFITNQQTEINKNIYVSDIQFRKKAYTIAANNLNCVSPTNVKSLLTQKLILNYLHSNFNDNTVLNNCLPKSFSKNLNGEIIQPLCAQSIEINRDIIMKGNYSVNECFNDIKKILKDQKINIIFKKYNIKNVFKGISSDDLTHFKFYNTFYTSYNTTFKNIIKINNSMINFLCDIERLTSHQNITKLMDICIYVITIEVILLNRYLFNETCLFSASSDHYSIIKDQKYLFGDPRIGINLAYNTSFFSLEVSRDLYLNLEDGKFNTNILQMKILVTRKISYAKIFIVLSIFLLALIIVSLQVILVFIIVSYKR